jgi:chlorite dismutase
MLRDDADRRLWMFRDQTEVLVEIVAGTELQFPFQSRLNLHIFYMSMMLEAGKIQHEKEGPPGGRVLIPQ